MKRGRDDIPAGYVFLYGLMIGLAEAMEATGKPLPKDVVDTWRRALIVLEVLQTYERRTLAPATATEAGDVGAAIQ